METRERKKLSKSIAISAISSSLSVLQFGFHMGVFNTPKELFIKCTAEPHCLKLNNTEYSILISLLPLTGLLGCFLTRKLMNFMGRKKSLLILNGFYFLGSVGFYFSLSKYHLYLSRILCGLAAGGSLTVNPVFLGEIAPLYLRGKIVIVNQIFLILGVILAQLLSALFKDPYLWRYLFLFSLGVSLIMFLVFPFCKESPAFVSSVMTDTAHCVTDTVGETTNLLTTTVKGTTSLLTNVITGTTHLINKEVEHIPVVKEINHIPIIKDLNPLNLVDILTHQVYKRILFLLSFIQLSMQFSGINAIIYYSTQMLQSSFPSQASTLTIFISVFQLGGTCAAYFLIEKGRKSLILSSSISMSLCTFLLAISLIFNWGYLSFIFMLLSIVTFAIGLGPIPFLLNIDLSNLLTIGVNSSICTQINLFFNFLVAFSFGYLADFLQLINFSIGIIFFFFSFWLALLSLILHLFLPPIVMDIEENIANSNQNFDKIRIFNWNLNPFKWF